jgi:hypothetical protein
MFDFAPRLRDTLTRECLILNGEFLIGERIAHAKAAKGAKEF